MAAGDGSSIPKGNFGMRCRSRPLIAGLQLRSLQRKKNNAAKKEQFVLARKFGGWS